MPNHAIQMNTAFCPPDKVAEHAFALSEQISTLSEPHYILNAKDRLPHLTIYSPEYPIESRDGILEVVDKIVQNVAPITMRVTDIRASRGWVVVNVENSQEIHELHTKIVKALNPLREDTTATRHNDVDLTQLSPEQLENVQTYGSKSLMNLYKPHLTLIRFKDHEAAERIAKSIQWKIPVFTINKIGVFTMADHGTCVAPIKIFNLK